MLKTIFLLLGLSSSEQYPKLESITETKNSFIKEYKCEKPNSGISFEIFKDSKFEKYDDDIKIFKENGVLKVNNNNYLQVRNMSYISFFIPVMMIMYKKLKNKFINR